MPNLDIHSSASVREIRNRLSHMRPLLALQGDRIEPATYDYDARANGLNHRKPPKSLFNGYFSKNSRSSTPQTP